MSSAREDRSRRTEAALRDAARRLFVAKGYAETRITDITSEAGRAAGSFYRYFADKDALLRSLADEFDEALHDRVVDRLGDDHRMAGTDDVRRHVRVYWDTFREHLPEMVALFQASMLSEDFRRIHHGLRDRHVDGWTRHVCEARGAAADAEEDRLTALAIVSMLEYFCYHQIAETSGHVDDEAAIETLTTMIATGLLGAPIGD